MSVTTMFVTLGLLVLIGTTTYAGKADVTKATAVCDGSSVCRFTVTVEHADAGWKHYADRWDVMSPNGEVLATRVLLHPHVGEQPFTRTLSGVRVPRELSLVRIRAHDSVHGYGGREISVSLSRSN